MKARIYNERFYVLETVPGISGFQRWDEKEQRLVTGRKARLSRGSVVGEWLPTDSDVFTAEDGHMPEHQTRMRGPQVVQWLKANPYQSALCVGHTLYAREAR